MYFNLAFSTTNQGLNWAPDKNLTEWKENKLIENFIPKHSASFNPGFSARVLIFQKNILEDRLD